METGRRENVPREKLSQGRKGLNMNFFDWIRQGVKRSVLEGVADAVDHLGTPVEQDQIREQLLAYSSADNSTNMLEASAQPAMRKRLGRGISMETSEE